MTETEAPSSPAHGDHRKRPLPAVMRAATAKPRPLINAKDGYGIIWSAKSACSSVALWHFSRLNMLDAALFYSPAFPHKFRADVVESSWTYRRWVERGDVKGIKWYWIARDPVNRALSSFRHNLRFGYDDANIGAALGREVSNESGYSFSEFISYLEATDTYSLQADFHIRSQQHPIMSFCPVTVFNIDRVGLDGALNAIERDLGLAPTDFAKLKGLDQLASRHHAPYADDSTATCSTVLTARMARDDWPFRRSCLDDEAIARLQAIYRSDIERIGEGTGNAVPAAPTFQKEGGT